MTVFEALSFDVLFEISTNLSLDDVIHLSQTCRQLRATLLNDTVAHQVVEVSETDLTVNAQLTFVPDTASIFSRSSASTSRIDDL